VDPNQDNETSTHVHNVTSTQENDSTRSRVTSNLADFLHRSLNSKDVGGTQLSRENLGDLVTEIFNQMGQNIPHMMRSVVSPTNSVASPIFREGSGNSAHHQSASSSSSTNQVGPDISSGFPYNQNTSIWRNFVENFIGESFATPLTSCDRSWEWFQLRIGLITGTSAGNIGLRIPALRCYLRSGTVEQRTDLDTFKQLANGWFYVKGKSSSQQTRAMEIGSKNEAGILKQLRKQKWVAAVFELGLLESNYIQEWRQAVMVSLLL